jgi:hypothetical protein
MKQRKKAALFEKSAQKLLSVFTPVFPSPPGAEVFCGAFFQKSDRLLTFLFS